MKRARRVTPCGPAPFICQFTSVKVQTFKGFSLLTRLDGFKDVTELGLLGFQVVHIDGADTQLQ